MAPMYALVSCARTGMATGLGRCYIISIYYCIGKSRETSRTALRAVGVADSMLIRSSTGLAVAIRSLRGTDISTSLRGGGATSLPREAIVRRVVRASRMHSARQYAPSDDQTIILTRPLGPTLPPPTIVAPASCGEVSS